MASIAPRKIHLSDKEHPYIADLQCVFWVSYDSNFQSRASAEWAITDLQNRHLATETQIILQSAHHFDIDKVVRVHEWNRVSSSLSERKA